MDSRLKVGSDKQRAQTREIMVSPCHAVLTMPRWRAEGITKFPFYVVAGHYSCTNIERVQCLCILTIRKHEKICTASITHNTVIAH